MLYKEDCGGVYVYRIKKEKYIHICIYIYKKGFVDLVLDYTTARGGLWEGGILLSSGLQLKGVRVAWALAGASVHAERVYSESQKVGTWV